MKHRSCLFLWVICATLMQIMYMYWQEICSDWFASNIPNYNLQIQLYGCRQKCFQTSTSTLISDIRFLYMSSTIDSKWAAAASLLEGSDGPDAGSILLLESCFCHHGCFSTFVPVFLSPHKTSKWPWNSMYTSWKGRGWYYNECSPSTLFCFVLVVLHSILFKGEPRCMRDDLKKG